MTGSQGTPLELQAIASILHDNTIEAVDAREALLAHCRALRAALQELLATPYDHAAVERAAAVLAQGRDE